MNSLTTSAANNYTKIKVTSADIVARMIFDTPYYEIKYREISGSEYNIGYGSYDLKYVMKWLTDCFEIVNIEDESYPQLLSETTQIQSLKFYYCASNDDYYVGCRVDTMYYGAVNPKTFDLTFFMSRYLPWGEHIISEGTLWKEHTYPSEPEEIDFSKWIKGWINKYITPEIKI